MACPSQEGEGYLLVDDTYGVVCDTDSDRGKEKVEEPDDVTAMESDARAISVIEKYLPITFSLVSSVTGKTKVKIEVLPLAGWGEVASTTTVESVHASVKALFDLPSNADVALVMDKKNRVGDPDEFREIVHSPELLVHGACVRVVVPRAVMISVYPRGEKGMLRTLVVDRKSETWNRFLQRIKVSVGYNPATSVRPFAEDPIHGDCGAAEITTVDALQDSDVVCAVPTDSTFPTATGQVKKESNREEEVTPVPTKILYVRLGSGDFVFRMVVPCTGEGSVENVADLERAIQRQLGLRHVAAVEGVEIREESELDCELSSVPHCGTITVRLLDCVIVRARLLPGHDNIPPSTSVFIPLSWDWSWSKALEVLKMELGVHPESAVEVKSKVLPSVALGPPPSPLPVLPEAVSLLTDGDTLSLVIQEPLTIRQPPRARQWVDLMQVTSPEACVDSTET
ncbi:unnamed protein product, partial [Choristocarpus tenellus]